MNKGNHQTPLLQPLSDKGHCVTKKYFAEWPVHTTDNPATASCFLFEWSKNGLYAVGHSAAFLHILLGCIEFPLHIMQEHNDVTKGPFCHVKFFPGTLICVIHVGNIPHCLVCLDLQSGYYCQVFDNSFPQAPVTWAQAFRTLHISRCSSVWVSSLQHPAWCCFSTIIWQSDFWTCASSQGHRCCILTLNYTGWSVTKGFFVLCYWVWGQHWWWSHNSKDAQG